MHIKTKWFEIKTWYTNGYLIEYGKGRAQYQEHLLIRLGKNKYKFNREY